MKLSPILILTLVACAPAAGPRWDSPVAPTAPDAAAPVGAALLGFCAGLIVREAAYHFTRRKMRGGRPVFPRVVRRDAALVALPDLKRWKKWRWAMRTFISAGEKCELKQNARGQYRPPLNVRGMQELTGLSARQQAKLKTLLLKGAWLKDPQTNEPRWFPVISVSGSDRAAWLMGTSARRAACNALDYPTDQDPPTFPLIPEDVWSESELRRK